MAAFPPARQDWSVLKSRMEAMRSHDIDWRAGRSALHVYYPGEDALEVARQAYGMFMWENALATAAFPSVQIMQDQLIAAAIELFHGPSGAAGSVTSGGTESTILVVKAARDRTAASFAERGCGEILLPETAHPAFEKAADLLGLVAKRIPAGPDHRADTDRLAAAITDRTILIIASAPSLPFGLIDPIDRLGEIALRYGVWLHVDACIGGYLAPFAAKLGFEVPAFDFSVPGVRSIAADLHKFGYAAKGASTVLYRSAEDMAFQSFSFSGWPKGLYQTPTLLGTRSAGAIAAAWAVMNYLGYQGYLDLTQRLMRLRDRFVAGVEAIDGLELVAQPDLSIVTFTSRRDNVAAIGAELSQRGWYVSRTATPPGIQQTLNLAHENALDDYLGDLAAAVHRVRSKQLVVKDIEVVTY